MNKLKLTNFFEDQFKSYSIYDSERSIANMIDGQKITSRKVLYTLNLKPNKEIKVAQLASSVAYETSYHHGEQGIGGVICNMAQNYAGANNINLLEPLGQFGSRLSPVPAAARYIFTELSPIFKTLFKKEDNLILEHHYDDDKQIEPKYYLPILPMILINGSSGIGTGFASKVLSYNPNDIKKDIISILKNKPRKPLVPWFNKFIGTVGPGENENQWVITGDLEVVNTTTIKITELPIGTYLDDIKATLSKLKDQEFIKDYDDYSQEDGFNIEVTCFRTTTSLPIEELYSRFKLVSKESENLTLWNQNHKLQVFKNASELISCFVEFRITKYEERRLALVKFTEEEILLLDERIRFIEFYLDNTKLFRNTGKTELFELLISNKFTLPDRLLSMTIYSLTKDKIEEYQKELEKKLAYLEQLETTTAKDIYLTELQELKL